MSKKTITALILVLASILFFSLGAEEDDRSRITELIEELRSTAELNKPLQKLEALERAGNLVKHFTESTEFDAESAGYEIVRNVSRTDLRQKMALAFTYLKKLEIEVDGLDLTIDDSTAVARFQVSILGNFSRNGEQFFDIHLVEAEFQKQNGEWLVSGGRHLENLRGQDGL